MAVADLPVLLPEKSTVIVADEAPPLEVTLCTINLLRCCVILEAEFTAAAVDLVELARVLDQAKISYWRE